MLRERVNQWEWLDGAPRVRVLKEYPQSTSKQSKRMRPLDRNRLSSPRVTGLSWSQVDLTRRTACVHADQAEARKAIAVPLSAAAVIVIREQIGKLKHSGRSGGSQILHGAAAMSSSFHVLSKYCCVGL